MRELMDADLRPLTRVLKKLDFTSPLDAEDDRYVPRKDGLGERLINRLLAPTTRMLLLAGPAGCGKSTELLHIEKELWQEYTTCFCPCNKDLDLYRLDEATLYRYVLWRVLSTWQSELTEQFTLTPEIVVEAQRRIGTNEMRMQHPFFFFANQPPPEQGRDVGALVDTLHRLFSEIRRVFLPVLLLLDGLEKVPPESAKVLRDFARSPALADYQAVMTIPFWLLYGWESPRHWPDVEVLEVPIVSGIEFVQEVVARRVGTIFDKQALQALAHHSGGVVRDGLSLAAIAARAALDDREPKVSSAQVEKAIAQLRTSYKQAFSDDLPRARQFLSHIKQKGELPPDREWRTRMLASGAVVPGDRGSFFVHPLALEL